MSLNLEAEQALKAAANQALVLASDHRQDAIDEGFSPEAAEAMAVSVHSMYLATQLNPDPET